MYKKHITDDLVAYCHNEMETEQSRLVAEHIIGCQKSRRQYEQIKLSVRLASQLRHVSAPATMWNEIEALLDKQAISPKDLAKDSPGFRLKNILRFGAYPNWARMAALAASFVLVISLGIVWYVSGSHRGSWSVATLTGNPTIGSGNIGKDSRLVIGQWLVTDSKSSARIEIADIGEVDIDPESRIRLIETRPTEHRMELQRGTLHAKITAPPRLFFVNTPSAEAVDLGCAYTLKVDDNGAGLLTVQLGYVAFVNNGHESIVPVGAMCATRPNMGPGTPYFHDAPEGLKDALTRFDFEQGGAEALNDILASVRERDAYTLWNLIPRVNGQDRERVFERLVALVPLPSSVTKEGILKLDHKMLERWSVEFEWGW